jgi:hypothetical protein
MTFMLGNAVIAEFAMVCPENFGHVARLAFYGPQTLDLRQLLIAFVLGVEFQLVFLAAGHSGVFENC